MTDTPPKNKATIMMPAATKTTQPSTIVAKMATGIATIVDVARAMQKMMMKGYISIEL